MNEPDYLTERLTCLLSLTFYIAPKLLEDQVFLRSPKILLPISNARHFPRTFLTSPWPGHLDIQHIPCLPSPLPIYPRTSTSTTTSPSSTPTSLGVYMCVPLRACNRERASGRVRASFPLFDTRATACPDVQSTSHTHNPQSASSFSIRICICIASHLHPGRPYLARAAPAPCACTTAVPQRQHRSISTPSKQNTFGVPSARQLESCLACHRQSRSVLHCYLLHYPTQPARCVSA